MKNKTILKIKLDNGTKIVVEGTKKEVKRIKKILKELEPNEN